MFKKVLIGVIIIVIGFSLGFFFGKKDNEEPVQNEVTNVAENIVENKEVVENETTNELEKETNKNEEAKLVNPNEFVGSFYSGRAVMEIEKVANNTFEVKIEWGDSAFSLMEWKYTCNYDEEKGYLHCDGAGVKTYVDYSNDEENGERTEKYSKGNAKFEMTDEGLIWIDEEENVAKDMVFTKK